jgi:hypothetical protein
LQRLNQHGICVWQTREHRTGQGSRCKPTRVWLMMFDVSARNTLQGEDCLFHKWCWENQVSHAKEWNWALRWLLMPYTQSPCT